MIRTLLAVALLATASTAAAEPLKFINGRLFIPAKVNQVATEALLDSGAEATIVDPALAARARFSEGTPQTMKGSGGEAQARIVEGVMVGALGVQLHPEAVVVLDMSDLSARLIKRPTQAIVGRELFDAARLRIDIAGRTLEVLDDHATPRGQRLELKTVNGIELLPVRVEGTEVLAALDIGNGSNVLLGADFARRRGLLFDGRRVTQEEGGGLGGKTQRQVLTLKALDIAGLSLRDLPASIDAGDSATDLNIGISVLRHFIVTTDFRAHAVWLQPR